jgi:hypothetical protein
VLCLGFVGHPCKASPIQALAQPTANLKQQCFLPCSAIVDHSAQRLTSQGLAPSVPFSWADMPYSPSLLLTQHSMRAVVRTRTNLVCHDMSVARSFSMRTSQWAASGTRLPTSSDYPFIFSGGQPSFSSRDLCLCRSSTSRRPRDRIRS